MKKIILGLSALIGSVSFANETIETNNFVEETINIIESDAWEYPCTELWVRDMDTLQSDFGATFEEALVLADRNFNKCLDEEYGN